MTCNYYLHYDICPRCNRPKEVLHIGLSAVGWCFLFQYYEGKAERVEDWKELTKHGKIVNEYDEEIAYQDFWEFVENKQKDGPDVMHAFLVNGYNFAKGEFS